MTNDFFIAQLHQFMIKPAYAELFSEIIVDTYTRKHKNAESHSEITKEIDLLNDSVKKASRYRRVGL